MMAQSTALAFMSVEMVFGVIIVTREKDTKTMLLLLMMMTIMSMLRVLLMSMRGLGNEAAESIVMLGCVMVRSK